MEYYLIQASLLTTLPKPLQRCIMHTITASPRLKVPKVFHREARQGKSKASSHREARQVQPLIRDCGLDRFRCIFELIPRRPGRWIFDCGLDRCRECVLDRFRDCGLNRFRDCGPTLVPTLAPILARRTLAPILARTLAPMPTLVPVGPFSATAVLAPCHRGQQLQ